MTTIRAVPYVVGDLAASSSKLSSPFLDTLELRPEAIEQFAGANEGWFPSASQCVA